MGEVYKATDTRLGRTVAIKVIPASVAGDATAKLRFEREARAIAALSHPHICALFDIGRDRGIDFLVMEYLEGQTLARRLSHGTVPLVEGLQYGLEISEALAALHRVGIIHRDLKPGNIMITPSGTKLLDFGLAKATRAPVALTGLTTQTELTREGAILGTVQYMAPEQIEGKELDARTDIFAFGAVLYEIVSGKRAFEGQNQAQLIASILRSEPVFDDRPMPAALEHAIRRCLHKNPEERWQNVGDLSQELRWVQTSGQRRSVFSAWIGKPTAGAPQARRRRRLVIQFTIGISLSVLAVALWVPRGSSPSSVADSSVADGYAVQQTPARPAEKVVPATTTVPATAPIPNSPRRYGKHKVPAITVPAAAGSIYMLDSGIEKPKIVHQVRPNYTAEALEQRIHGSVILAAVVLPDGSVGDVHVIRSLDKKYGLDEEAVKAAKQWRFEPVRKGGQPVPVQMKIELTFTLKK